MQLSDGTRANKARPVNCEKKIAVTRVANEFLVIRAIRETGIIARILRG